MDAKTYCSTVCEAKCCKRRPPLLSPSRCPMLGDDNLCTIYKDRIGYSFEGVREGGVVVKATCKSIEEALPEFPESVREQCCYAHPELLDQP